VNAVWAFVRLVVKRLGAVSARDGLLAVPRMLGKSRKRAERFAWYWRTYVGGGQLVDTRDAAAATAILEARSTSRMRAVVQRLQYLMQ
jgi:hypothetical protein